MDKDRRRALRRRRSRAKFERRLHVFFRVWGTGRCWDGRDVTHEARRQIREGEQDTWIRSTLTPSSGPNHWRFYGPRDPREAAALREGAKEARAAIERAEWKEEQGESAP